MKTFITNETVWLHIFIERYSHVALTNEMTVKSMKKQKNFSKNVTKRRPKIYQLCKTNATQTILNIIIIKCTFKRYLIWRRNQTADIDSEIVSRKTVRSILFSKREVEDTKKYPDSFVMFQKLNECFFQYYLNYKNKCLLPRPTEKGPNIDNFLLIF